MERVLVENGYDLSRVSVVSNWKAPCQSEGVCVYGVRLCGANGQHLFALYYDGAGRLLDRESRAALGVTCRPWPSMPPEPVAKAEGEPEHTCSDITEDVGVLTELEGVWRGDFPLADLYYGSIYENMGVRFSFDGNSFQGGIYVTEDMHLYYYDLPVGTPVQEVRGFYWGGDLGFEGRALCMQITGTRDYPARTWSPSSDNPEVWQYEIEGESMQLAGYSGEMVLTLTRSTDAEGEGEGEGYFEGEIEGEVGYNPDAEVFARIPDRYVGTDGCVLVPVSVSSADGISPNGIDVVVRYDSKVLDPERLSVEATAITGRMSFTANVSQPGLIRIVAVGDPRAELRGNGHLFDIRACLENRTSSECTPLRFSFVEFNDARAETIEVDYSDRGEICPPSGFSGMGDLNADGRVTSKDVLLALGYAVGRTGPLGEDTAIQVADFNGDLMLDSADAVMLQRFAAELPVNPGAYTEETGADPMLLSVLLEEREQVTVRVGDERATVGETVTLAVSVSNAVGISGYQFTLTYPKSSLRAVEARPGTVVGAYPQTYEAGDGFIRVSMGRKDAFSDVQKATDAILAWVDFEVLEVPEGGVAPVRIEFPALKGQYGDSFEWYTAMAKEHGEVTISSAQIIPGCGTVRAERASGFPWGTTLAGVFFVLLALLASRGVATKALWRIQVEE